MAAEGTMDLISNSCSCANPKDFASMPFGWNLLLLFHGKPDTQHGLLYDYMMWGTYSSAARKSLRAADGNRFSLARQRLGQICHSLGALHCLHHFVQGR